MSDVPDDPLTWPELLVWCALAAGGAGALLVGSRLRPDPSGLGTHGQLGLAPCSFLESSGGVPCPTCGYTTAVAHLAQGQPLAAVRVQPFGALIGLLMGLAPLGLLRVVWTRRSLLWPIIDRSNGAMLAAGLGAFLASWAYKWATMA